MTDTPASVQRIYLTLTLLTTLAASFIWGVNTLFLLDAGLSNAEAFAANAFFSVGQVIFEVPTGVVADTRGRRFSFLLGAATLLASTLLYLWMWQIQAPFVGWALASLLLGLGFTFFSGATEAWLVDALAATRLEGDLETVFGRAQVVGGGGDARRLRAGRRRRAVHRPRDAVHHPRRAPGRHARRGLPLHARHRLHAGARRHPVAAVRTVVNGAIDGGLRNPPVRWLMFAAPFTPASGSTPSTRSSRTCSSCTATRMPTASPAWRPRSSPAPDGRRLVGALGDGCSGADDRCCSVLAVIVVASRCIGVMPFFVGRHRPARRRGRWPRRSRSRSAGVPQRPHPVRSSARRSSFDSLMGSAGGVVIQPALGRAADLGGYGASYLRGRRSRRSPSVHAPRPPRGRAPPTRSSPKAGQRRPEAPIAVRR